MKKIYTLLAAAAALTMTGCKDNGGSIDIPTPQTIGYYILGEGSWGAENSTLKYYDLASSTLSDRFTTANPGQILGGTANDMVVYGSKLYVVVTDNNKVLALDAATGRILADIPMGQAGGADRQPRAAAAAAGKVFVSLYSGEVARIDTASFTTDYTTYGGTFLYSEGIAVVGGTKLCVANSGHGIGTTVSVIDVATFSKQYDITVPVNPNQLAVTSAGDVYLATWVEYDAQSKPVAPAALHKLNFEAKTYATVPNVEAQRLAIYGNTAYVVNTTYDALTFVPSSTLVAVDLRSNAVTTMIDAAAGAGMSFYGVDVNPQNGYLYVSDGQNNKVLRFDEKGATLSAITNAGTGVNTVAFVTKK